MAKREVYFRGAKTRGYNDEYKHLRIQVWYQGKWSEKARPEFQLFIEYQADKGNGQKWYSGDWRVSEARTSDHLRKAQQLVARCERWMEKLKSGSDSRNSPGLVIDALRHMGAIEVVYDPRLSDYVPLADVMPEEFQRYYMKGTNFYTGVWAQDIHEARQLLFARAILTCDSEAAWIKEWRERGEPVEVDGRTNVPDLLTAEETLAIKW